MKNDHEYQSQLSPQWKNLPMVLVHFVSLTRPFPYIDVGLLRFIFFVTWILDCVVLRRVVPRCTVPRCCVATPRIALRRADANYSVVWFCLVTAWWMCFVLSRDDLNFCPFYDTILIVILVIRFRMCLRHQPTPPQSKNSNKRQTAPTRSTWQATRPPRVSNGPIPEHAATT